jgi:hypothetical protein
LAYKRDLSELSLTDRVLLVGIIMVCEMHSWLVGWIILVWFGLVWFGLVGEIECD